jgi:glycosyltransferase involved in cell wall biosynthesis
MLRAGVQPDRVIVQHNTVLPFVRPPEAELNRLRAGLGIGANTRVILSVGRLSHEKGHNDLIKAADTIRRESPTMDFRLVFVGSGPERESLQRLSIQRRVENLVIFAGYQANVTPYFAIADVFALPSHSEGSPNALLEAMAAGVPCIATAVGGTPEIAFHGDNALLIQKGDVAGMAQGILRLLSDPKLRDEITRQGVKVTERFSPESHRRNIVKLFQDLLDNRHK